MTRHELMVHLLGIVLNLAIAIGRVAETPADKARAKAMEDKLDEWLAIVSPPEL